MLDLDFLKALNEDDIVHYLMNEKNCTRIGQLFFENKMKNPKLRT